MNEQPTRKKKHQEHTFSELKFYFTALKIGLYSLDFIFSRAIFYLLAFSKDHLYVAWGAHVGCKTQG